MVEFREGIAHADSLAQNNPAQSFSVQLIQVLVTGGGRTKKTSRIELARSTRTAAEGVRAAVL